MKDDTSPLGAIQADALAGPQSLRRLVDAHYSRDAVLAGHNRAVGHHPAHLHNSPPAAGWQ